MDSTWSLSISRGGGEGVPSRHGPYPGILALGDIFLRHISRKGGAEVQERKKGLKRV